MKPVAHQVWPMCDTATGGHRGTIGLPTQAGQAEEGKLILTEGQGVSRRDLRAVVPGEEAEGEDLGVGGKGDARDKACLCAQGTENDAGSWKDWLLYSLGNGC